MPPESVESKGTCFLRFRVKILNWCLKTPDTVLKRHAADGISINAKPLPDAQKEGPFYASVMKTV